MAITEVASRRAASGANDGVDSADLAFPNNVTSGNLLICAGAVWHSTTAPTSIVVTSTRSGTFTTILGTVLGTWRTFIAYAVATGSGACTVTVNPNTSTNSFSFSIDEFTGQHATPNSVDGGTSQGNVTLNNPFTASDSITTSTANELIIGSMSHDLANTGLTAGASQTTIGENEVNGNNQCHHVVFRIATTATSYTMSVDGANADPTASPGWSMQTYSFKEAVAGGANPKGPLSNPLAGPFGGPI